MSLGWLYLLVCAAFGAVWRAGCCGGGGCVRSAWSAFFCCYDNVSLAKSVAFLPPESDDSRGCSEGRFQYPREPLIDEQFGAFLDVLVLCGDLVGRCRAVFGPRPAKSPTARRRRRTGDGCDTRARGFVVGRATTRTLQLLTHSPPAATASRRRGARLARFAVRPQHSL